MTIFSMRSRARKYTVAPQMYKSIWQNPVHYEGTLQVRFSETEKESDGDVMWLSPNETELPLGQYIYESISLSLPYRKIHPEDANGNSLCNPDMLSRFKIVSEEEFDRFVQQSAQEAQNDNQTAETSGKSPWSELEKLKQKLEQEQLDKKQ